MDSPTDRKMNWWPTALLALLLGVVFWLLADPTAGLLGIATAVAAGYARSPENEWKPRSPAWVIAPIAVGALLTPIFWPFPAALAISALVAALVASPHMRWHRWLLVLAGVWFVLQIGYFVSMFFVGI